MAPKGRGSGRNKKLTLGDYVLALVENAFGYGRASTDTIMEMANLLQRECIDAAPDKWISRLDQQLDQQALLNSRLLELQQLVKTTANEWLDQETSDSDACAAHLAKNRYRKCAFICHRVCAIAASTATGCKILFAAAPRIIGGSARCPPLRRDMTN